eukprot:6179462-Pleurochrysis_carterae.AAC.1
MRAPVPAWSLPAPRASRSFAPSGAAVRVGRGGVCSSSLSPPAAPAYSRYPCTVSAPSRNPTCRSKAATAALGSTYAYGCALGLRVSSTVQRALPRALRHATT